ncbi:MAG: tRNA (adenosine(37)-N6)-threonylcarbamoyltransferase complex transferase subunit TsaD [Candidatus Altiarchaeota archaeon]|nr:tRNA (adenosine(37)-N6)-threonylcarbamoyltransferase complex transferase subunit TsaD [Candidatus Altiarchaeota archaeon]
MKVLGIESTAHSFGVGMVIDNKIASNVVRMFEPDSGGIHPSESADFLARNAASVIKAGMIEPPELIAYSAGPGIGHCLKVGMIIAKYLAVKYKTKLVPVNHAEAHIEIGLKSTGVTDPLVVYVSGGNTQIIADNQGWRVFGETQDISLGNAVDKLARKFGLSHPGGPKIEKLAKTGKKFIEMPYIVKGMDLSYSGLVTHAANLIEQESQADIAYSFQEHCFAMLTEISERAMAHLDKKNLLLVGGVAQNKRLQEMMDIMCKERGAKSFVVPAELAGDNGAMIAWSGLVHKDKAISPEKAWFEQKWRLDQSLI